MEQLIIIRTLAELHKLVHDLEAKTVLAFDTETTGIEKGSEIIGCSICADVEVGYYVIFSEWNVEQGKLVYLETLQGADLLFQILASKPLVMHNAVFDCFMVETNYSVKLMPSVIADTMIMAHVLDETRKCGLKELGVSLFGEDARKEQLEMKESVAKNGGELTKANYELYKADSELIARYGAKDAILTFKLFEVLSTHLAEQPRLMEFFFDESMPLLRGPTYDLNTTGLRVDPRKLQNLRGTLEAECAEAKAFIYNEITPHVKEKYPGTSEAKTFNIGSTTQLCWLLFFQLDNDFNTLTTEGKELCKHLDMKIPYSPSARKEFIAAIRDRYGQVWRQPGWFNEKTKKKLKNAKKIGDPWTYIQCGKESLTKLSEKYTWVKKLLEYRKNLKLLNTYVDGIQARAKYNIIRPNFLQHGTTSGRYSSRDPNFQNLPRDDKRIKSCIIAREGKVFVGADYFQLEPRVFASFSKDERLLNCFNSGQDFYSVIGAEVFEKPGAGLVKDDSPTSFAARYPKERQLAKVIALAVTYGTTPGKLSMITGKPIDECRYIVDRYFESFPNVELLMLESHEMAKKNGQVENLFGRVRHIPDAKDIYRIYKDTPHVDLPYQVRGHLNLAVNHRIQSTAASIMNRAAIALWNAVQELAKEDPRWNEVKIVLQVHDELVLEGPEALSDDMTLLLKHCMENTVELPGIKLEAQPKVANNLGDLK